MKFIGCIVVFALLFNFSMQIPQFENCSPEFIARHQNGCGRITCYDGGRGSAGVGCGTYRCAEGKTIGYTRPDNSKPYPDCCGGPRCAE